MSLKSAYGAGFRAGITTVKRPHFLKHSDGTKTITHPKCPFPRKRQFVLRLVWNGGLCDGMMKALRHKDTY